MDFEGEIVTGGFCTLKKTYPDLLHPPLIRMDEHGYFAFGGSTCLIIFQKNKIAFDRDLVENSSQCIETLVKVGNSIGRAFTIDTLSKSQEQLIIQQAASTENLVFH